MVRPRVTVGYRIGESCRRDGVGTVVDALETVGHSLHRGDTTQHHNRHKEKRRSPASVCLWSFSPENFVGPILQIA